MSNNNHWLIHMFDYRVYIPYTHDVCWIPVTYKIVSYGIQYTLQYLQNMYYQV